MIEEHRLLLRDAVSAIAAAADERSASRAASEAARILAAAERAAVYVRVPGLGWRRTGGTESRNLPAVVPDPDGTLSGAALSFHDINLTPSSEHAALAIFAELGIKRIIGTPFSIGDDTAAYLVAFDAAGTITPDRSDAFSAIAIHLGAVLERISGADRFRAVADAIPQLVWTTNADGVIEWCNSRWIAYTGISLGRMLAGDGNAALHPDDFEAIERAWSIARMAPIAGISCAASQPMTQAA